MTFVMVAPTGARLTPADHPALPVTITQITNCAQACQKAGASALHLHVRDQTGRHSLDSGRYCETLTELKRSVPRMRVQITTESAGIFSVEDQLKCLRGVRPDWVTISVRETARSPELASTVYGFCAENGITVQHILYDTDDAALLRRWQADGTVRPGQDGMLFVLGRYAKHQLSTPADLEPFLSDRRANTSWMLCAFGPHEHACLLAAARQGGDVRVGFENSRTATDGTRWASNTASVRALVQHLSKLADNAALTPPSETFKQQN